MKSAVMFVVPVAVLMGLMPALGWAGETKILLREYLNQQWTRELLTYPFSAPEGACHADSVTLTDPRGEPLPMQLSQVEFWPGTQSVKAAKLSFVADLAPLAADTYTVRYAQEQEPRDPPPATDLTVRVGQNEVTLATDQFGLRLLLGEQTWDQPRDAAQVPGPVLAMRRPGGEWFGGSSLYGERRVKSYSARLAANGRVLAEWTIRYTYEDGSTLDLTVQLASGDALASWVTHSSADSPDDGWKLRLGPGLEPLSMSLAPEFGKNKWKQLKQVNGRWDFDPQEVPLDPEPEGMITQLTPWNDWWDGTTQTTWTFKNAAGDPVLHAGIQDAGAWVEPAAPGTLRDWDAWQHKLLPLWKEPDGVLAVRVNNAQGLRKWLFGSGGQALGRRLNVVKDYVLDWPGDAGSHPHMFLTRGEMQEARAKRQPLDPALTQSLKNFWVSGPLAIPSYHDCFAMGAYLLTGDPQVAAEAKVVERFRNHMSLQGKFDTMRYTCMVVEYYDTLIDDPVVPEAERGYLRALMAYLGYHLADPATWSCERGYRSYNLNMSVANVLNLGMMASALPTHPKAKEWVEPALAMLEAMLEEVGPAGEWGESVTNYTGVTASSMLAFAIAAKNAGFRDYVNDPRMKKLLLYLPKMYTPPDPRGGGQRLAGYRALPPHGRAGAGGRDGLIAAMARATAESDPAYSRQLQWMWLESGAPMLYHDSRLGGLEYLYLDKSLPAERPDWGSDLFPLAGTVFRNGLGTKDEHQVNLITGDFSHAIFPSETGAFSTIFSYGRPVAGSFAGGYAEREEYLMSRVCIARELESMEVRKQNGGYGGFPYNLEESATGKRVVKDEARFGEREGIATVSGFSSLPRQDYTAADILMKYKRGVSWDLVSTLPPWPPVPQAGKPPVDWRRQVLFLKDDDPAGPNYLLLRDTVQGGQPTMWQMWTVSEKVGTAAEAQDLAAFLQDKPGDTIVPPRELRGDRFTAIGQFDVDVEYYVARPTDTPRHTLRWGTKYNYSPVAGFSEYHDLLHLQIPGDGAYFVAFYPRKRDWPAPSFSTLGEGQIIKVAGDFGTDYGFLSARDSRAEGEDATFQGTAGSVQDRMRGLVLSLAAPGEISYKEYGLAADFAACLRVADRRLALELPEKVTAGGKAVQPMVRFPGGTVRVSAPGTWALDQPPPGVRLVKTAAGWELTVPEGLRAVALSRQG